MHYVSVTLFMKFFERVGPFQLTFGNLCSVAISDIFIKKLDSLSYISAADIIGLSSSTLT